MPQLANAFSLQTHAANSWSRAAAFVEGNYDLTATIHRGIDLGAHFDVETGVKGQIEDNDARVTAALSGALSAGIQATAAFPIDLFGQAGLIARVKAEATAAAYLRAELVLAVSRLAERRSRRDRPRTSAVSRTRLGRRRDARR